MDVPSKQNQKGVVSMVHMGHGLSVVLYTDWPYPLEQHCGKDTCATEWWHCGDEGNGMESLIEEHDAAKNSTMGVRTILDEFLMRQWIWFDPQNLPISNAFWGGERVESVSQSAACCRQQRGKPHHCAGGWLRSRRGPGEGRNKAASASVFVFYSRMNRGRIESSTGNCFVAMPMDGMDF